MWQFCGSWWFPIRPNDAMEIRAAVRALRSEGEATHVVADARGDTLGVEIYTDAGERADAAGTNLHVLCATPWTSDRTLAALLTHVLESIDTDRCWWHVYHPEGGGDDATATASAWFAALARIPATLSVNVDHDELRDEMRAFDSNSFGVGFTTLTKSEMVELVAAFDDDNDDAAADGHFVMEISIPRAIRVKPPPSSSSSPSTYRVGGWLARFERGLMGRIREIVVRSDHTGAHRSVRSWSVGKHGASVGVARVELNGGQGRIGVPIGAVGATRDNWIPCDAMPAELAHRSREAAHRSRGDVTVIIRDDITDGDRDAEFVAGDRGAWLLGAIRFCDRRLYICDTRDGAHKIGGETAEEIF
ncbi:hypothetical protein CYMTET_27564 [Cymbomonas tetramitiformis]|uniref:Uncharacterized protein n=1 Tax=Cymbomonas tetramitiformis TaxID=36881 RepID=A0AAE0KX23_9CHLO|nr:hypothetical protein CYMTET_27564 [Cymbomonas tetramitiformis]